MIEEAYVSFEVAKLLKDKGFGIEEETRGYYPIKGDAVGRLMFGAEYHHNTSQVQISAPTHQMACAWLRKKYCLHFVIQPMMSIPSCELKWSTDTYDTSIFYKELSEFRRVAETKLCDSPEEAVEAALKYSLENLI